MPRGIKRTPCPRSQQTYPSNLATVEEVRALGLRPGTREPGAILEYAQKDRSGICALFERDRAVRSKIQSPISGPG